MSFKPLADNVLVEQLEAKTQTASGLILPSSDVEKPQRATVVAVGPGKRLKDGSRSTMSVSEDASSHLRLGIQGAHTSARSRSVPSTG